jgi:hypothetical protein
MVERPFRYVQEQLVGEHFFTNGGLVHMVIPQKIGRAAPSVAATLIEGLPDENDPQRPVEEKIARNVAAISYIGLWPWQIDIKSRMIHLLYFISRR